MILLKAKNVITGDGKTVIENGGVVYAEDTILAVGKATELEEEFPQAQIRDYGEASILPGLMDAHIHLGYYWTQPDLHHYNDFMIAYYAQKQAETCLAKGVTTIRDCCGPQFLLETLRLAAEKGFVKAPRILHTDRGICITGGHGHEDGIEEVDGVENIRHTIRRQKKDGADWIKMLTTNRDDICEFTQEELNAGVAEAHRLGMKCVVHSGTQPGIQMCIEAGFDTIEHGNFLTVEQAKQMVKNQQSWTPTMFAYHFLAEYNQKVQEVGIDHSNQSTETYSHHLDFFESSVQAYEENFKAIYDEGVTILAGTDMVMLEAPSVPIVEELELMVNYGLTPVEAIQTATQNPAKVFELAEVTGELKRDLQADIVVVDGDVAKNIQDLRNVRQVFLAGIEV
ncbi:amidohydrolase family protein [Enterococcus dongliensis]|uniref:Amidohydrolase family protein n=1 Tax=Enterococcus dongliensis TaxID=2559925 RepID=A0AAP5NGA7_9ENTE|nr:amidohydrolase family protein [Enterococcus dongliensis]MDT2596001.1 amidohydrolase family protein [Enterococcus dongliensis]MDT2603443.1 amidohydrolase family protein [Enterococcus dongliensis]MDT2634338.1 amidohydrolase family protein [Enterococcus dongliensis]MDT2636855.1 amidohydrolase family protein [Enterococcus dongliensis]MDT2642051.1 amidohydrolase family protein [Enterococcus dongliensis]